MTDKPLHFIFNCNDPALTMRTARKLVQPVGKIVNESSALSGSFLIETTKEKADAFAASYSQWKVYPETFVPLPRQPFRSIKSPAKD